VIANSLLSHPYARGVLLITMKNQKNSQSIKEFLSWRENLYHGVNARKETVMELVDALSLNSIASSVVELSEHPLFRRGYNSLYKGIQ